MEKVQFQIESTLPELKDLDARGLFTRTELGQITARRTKWETALVKRVARKEDYLGYAQYEMGLERLRRARVKRLGMDKGGIPRGVSGHSIVRRVLFILRRATDKFPYDLGIWLAYVDYARSEGMTKVVLQGLTTALQLHPRSAALYILLSQHYLDPSAPSPTSSKRRTRQPNFAIENVSPARKTLLLGLRFLPADKDLWREYIKLEVGWVEALRRRWKVLGIDLAGEEDAGGDAAGKMEADVQAGLPRNDASNDNDDDDDDDAVAVADLGQNAFGASGEQARKAIIRGDLVITVLESAFRNPALAQDVDFCLQLVALFRRYPTGLRPRLLEAVYAHMEHEPALVWNTVARRTVIERSLYDAVYDPETEAKRAQGAEEVVLQGEALVSELGRVVKALRTGGHERSEGAPDGWQATWNQEVGSWLLRWADKMAVNQDLQAYLVASVSPLTKPTAQPTEELLVKHLAYIGQLEDDSPARPSPAKLVALAKSYTDMYPSSSALWTRRLEIELSHTDSPSALASIYLQAMTAVGAASDAITVWRAAMEWFDAQVPPGEDLMEPHWRQAIKAARKFVGDVNVPGQQGEELYAALLEAWVEKKLVAPASVGPIVAEACSTTWDAPFQLYPPLFQTIARYAAPPADLAPALSTVHRLRLQKSRNELDRVEAALDWASWAMTPGAATGHVKSAWTAIEDMKREIEAREIKPGVAQIEQERIRREALDKLEVGWKAILARVEEDREEEEVEEDVHMD